MTVRSLFTYSARQINELEEMANENPNDADVQAKYLKVHYIGEACPGYCSRLKCYEIHIHKFV